jgi:hypothetical protein
VCLPVAVAEAPEFSFAVGPFEARTYFGRVAWVSASGQEGWASPVTSYDSPSGTVPSVRAVNAPAGAVGFHVYLGLAPESLTRQTDQAVAAGQWFTLPGTGLVAGVAPGEGQAPDQFVTGGQTMRRG